MGDTEEGTVILQGEDGVPLSEQEIANLLAQQGDGDLPDDGTAQIIDGDGNTVTVTAEQMAAVGIDPNNMTEINEEQIQTLLQLAQAQTAQPPPVAKAEPKQAMMEEVAMTGGEGEEDGSGELTMVIGDDGSLRLVDTTGTEFLLGADQLQAAGIDPANLTEENVQTIVQLAMNAGASAGEGTKRKAETYDDGSGGGGKRMRVGDLDIDPSELTEAVGEDGTLRLLDQNGQEIQVAVSDHVSSALPRRGPGPAANRSGGNRTSGGRGFALIGQEVEVRKGGRSMNATIRYCRHGAGYKVQFDDGHFEWVSEDQVTLKPTKGRPEAMSPTMSSKPNGMSPSMASTLGRRVPPAIPGIRVTSQAESKQPPNFLCPICEKKVHQKEPAYIVIRLPACETCADSKILVLDQDSKESEENEMDDHVHLPEKRGAAGSDLTRGDPITVRDAAHSENSPDMTEEVTEGQEVDESLDDPQENDTQNAEDANPPIISVEDSNVTSVVS